MVQSVLLLTVRPIVRFLVDSRNSSLRIFSEYDPTPSPFVDIRGTLGQLWYCLPSKTTVSFCAMEVGAHSAFRGQQQIANINANEMVNAFFIFSVSL